MSPYKQKMDPAKGTTTLFASRVYQVPGAKAVYYKVDLEGVVRLWTVIWKDHPDIRDQIYDIEAEIYERYPDECVDFYVIDLTHVSEEALIDVIPSDFVLVPR